MTAIIKINPHNCHNAQLASTLDSENPSIAPATMSKPVNNKLHSELTDNSQLRRYLAKRAQSSEDAADIYQESVARVLEQAQKRPITNPIAYAIRVARNLLISKPMSYENGIDEIDAPHTNPEYQMEESQRIDLIYEALKAMPEQRRKVFELRRINGESRQAIAQQLGISTEAVTRHISRAMVDIQKYIDAKTQ